MIFRIKSHKKQNKKNQWSKTKNKIKVPVVVVAASVVGNAEINNELRNKVMLIFLILTFNTFDIISTNDAQSYDTLN